MSDEVTKLDDHRGDSGSSGTHSRVSRENVRAHDPGAQVRRLKCFNEITDMVMRGELVRDIVTYIHGEGELTHLSVDAVSKIVMRYKRHVLAGREDKAIVVGGNGQVDGIDRDNPASVVFVLQEMFYLMRKRITMEAGTEESLNKLFSTTHREFLTMSMMSRDLIRAMDKFDVLEDVRRSPGGDKAGGEIAGRVKLQEVATNPESRHKLLGILSMVMNRPGMMDGLLKNMDTVEGDKKKNRPKRKKNKKSK